jgi:hypothetical protein
MTVTKKRLELPHTAFHPCWGIQSLLTRNTIIDHNTCMHKECLRNCRVGAKRFGPVFYVGSSDFWSTLISCGVPNAFLGKPLLDTIITNESVHYAPFFDTGHGPPAMTASTSWISRGHFVKFSQPSAVTTCSGMEKIRPPLCSSSTVTKNYSQVMSVQRCLSLLGNQSHSY